MYKENILKFYIFIIYIIMNKTNNKLSKKKLKELKNINIQDQINREKLKDQFNQNYTQMDKLDQQIYKLFFNEE